MKNVLLFCLLGVLLPVPASAQSLDAGVVLGNEAALSIAVLPMPYKGSGKALTTRTRRDIRVRVTARTA